MANIIYLTDYPVNATSGYATIAKPLCNALQEKGHEVKVLGLSNKGEEHWENFAIIPIADLGEAQAAIHNLTFLWKPDVLIMALDIPNLEALYPKIAHTGLKCIAITPLENGPLTQSWAMALTQFHKVFFISELGETEARKVGLQNVGHLRVGIDTDLWYPATDEERTIARKNLGFEQDDNIVLTVADNQERKNLWAGMKIVQQYNLKHPEKKAKYIIVTNENAPWGWRLQELATSMGMMNEFIVFERGMPQEQLRLLYACADVFLLPSKAEGLGLPILEAMSMGVTCVATHTGALTELIADGGGWLVKAETTFIDVWGNSERALIDIEDGVRCLDDAIKMYRLFYDESIEYVKNRTIEQPLTELEKAIEEITNAKN